MKTSEKAAADLIKELRADQLAYVKSIGATDREHTLAAFAEEGDGTVLRVCIAPSLKMPLRTLGYIAVAEHIQRTYMPRATLEVVATAHAVSRVNEVQQALGAARHLQQEAFYLPGPNYDVSEGSRFMVDRPGAPPIDEGRIVAMMRNTPMHERLVAKADRRGSTYVPYLAAHLLMHDVVDSVDPLSPNDEMQSQGERHRLISIGAQSERTFYSSRMRCREAPLLVPGMAEETGQIFTRHVVPPYQFSRPQEGVPYFDPGLSDTLALNDSILDDQTAVRSSSVMQDLAYLRDYMRTMYDTYN